MMPTERKKGEEQKERGDTCQRIGSELKYALVRRWDVVDSRMGWMHVRLT